MKRKVEIALNIVIAALALLLTVLFAIGDNLIAAAGFLLIVILNGIALALRFGKTKE